MKEIEKKIVNLFKTENKKTIKKEKIYKILKKIDKNDIENNIKSLIKKGIFVENRGKILYDSFSSYKKAKIVRQCNGFFVAKTLKEETEFIIDEKDSKFALKGDIVLIYVKNFKSKKAKVEKILKEAADLVIGTIILRSGLFFVKPDNINNILFTIEKKYIKNVEENDRVVVKISARKNKNKLNSCEIIANYKNSQKAIDAADAFALSCGASFEFAQEVLMEAKNLERKNFDKELKTRKDLTNKIIFTIDSKHSKDLDDAVSIEKFKDNYILGVHIADVSYYVPFKSNIEKEALKRGFSIYYGDKVLPMLPEILSNNLCSLNPGYKKLAFSVFMNIDYSGKIKNFKFEKTIIKSKIKGIYEEINELFNKKDNSIYYEKYKDILPALKDMYSLYKLLKKRKINRGAPEIQTKESIVYLNENNITTNIEEKKTGISEEIIEEFMICANEAAAKLAKKEGLPFIYRVHETPPCEKIIELKKLIEKIGIDAKKIKPGLCAKTLANLLKKFKNTDMFNIINNNVLQSMSKAKYEAKASPHFGLVLKNYSHFTSPIRRYPDLFIHRILNEYISKKTKPKILYKKYKNYAKKFAKAASKAEIKSKLIERAALSCFKAEFIKSKIGEKFNGIIISVIKTGMFVTLKNTIQGFVFIKSCGENFEFVPNIGFFKNKSNISYKIGDKIKVKCVSANVISGKIDFVIVDN